MRPTLLHPVPLAAMVLLVANDHVLKARWPGVVTGKLSDIAGLVFFPLFLDALVALLPGGRPVEPRRRLIGCVVATVVVFAAVKTWAPATMLYKVGLGLLQWPFVSLFALLQGRAVEAPRVVSLVRDPTDLIALPFAATCLFLGARKPAPPPVSLEG